MFKSIRSLRFKKQKNKRRDDTTIGSITSPVAAAESKPDQAAEKAIGSAPQISVAPVGTSSKNPTIEHPIDPPTNEPYPEQIDVDIATETSCADQVTKTLVSAKSEQNLSFATTNEHNFSESHGRLPLTSAVNSTIAPTISEAQQSRSYAQDHNGIDGSMQSEDTQELLSIKEYLLKNQDARSDCIDVNVDSVNSRQDSRHYEENSQQVGSPTPPQRISDFEMADESPEVSQSQGNEGRSLHDNRHDMVLDETKDEATNTIDISSDAPYRLDGLYSIKQDIHDTESNAPRGMEMDEDMPDVAIGTLSGQNSLKNDVAGQGDKQHSSLTSIIDDDSDMRPKLLFPNSSNGRAASPAALSFEHGPGVERTEKLQRQYPKAYDLSERIHSFYRILDLVKERGSGGLVDKIIISQESYGHFINALRPGAYTSITQCDFNALDKDLIKVVGVYGDRHEIVRYLRAIHAVDEETALILKQTTDEDSTAQRRPYLRPGLYGAIQKSDVLQETIVHLIYWPEDSTWNDDAQSDARRNRVTFIRYLTKTADQVVALISSQQAEALVWKICADDDGKNDIEDDSDRLFSFEVSKSKEQDENVTVHEGFRIPIPPSQAVVPPTSPQLDLNKVEPSLAAGETASGYVSVEFVPERRESSSLSEAYYPPALESFIESQSFQLSDSLDEDTLQILLTHGLPKRVPEASEALKKARETAMSNKQVYIAEETKIIKSRLEQEKPEIIAAIHSLFFDYLVSLHLNEADLAEALFSPATSKVPLSEHLEASSKSLPGNGYDHPEGGKATLPKKKDDSNEFLKRVYELHPSASLEVEKTLDNLKVKNITDDEYRDLKKRIICADIMLRDCPDLVEKQSELVKPFFQAGDVSRAYSAVVASTESAKGTSKSWLSLLSNSLSSISSFFSADTIEKKIKAAQRHAQNEDDHAFLRGIDDIVARYPMLAEHSSHAIHLATKAHMPIALRRAQSLMERLISDQEQDCRRKISEKAEIDASDAFNSSRVIFLSAVKDRLFKYDHRCHYHITRISQSRSSRYNADFKLHGTQETYSEPRLRYKIYPFDLPERDCQGLQSNSAYVPSPTINPRSVHEVELPAYHTVVHLQLLKGGKCLFLVQVPGGNTHVYLDDLASLGQAVERVNHKKQVHKEKIGERYLLAYDEANRQLAFCASNLQLHAFVFDDGYTSLNGVGSAMELKHMYDPTVYVTAMTFVGQQEEIALLDSSNRVRVFSLLTQRFRPAAIQLQYPPDSMFSTPDGSCLCCVKQLNNATSIRLFHWSNFGSTDGIVHELPGFSAKRFTMTSFVNRCSIYLIGLNLASPDCQSVALDITKKVTEFSFSEKGNRNNQDEPKDMTAHNCLLDCHSEVWTKFPVVAALRRQMSDSGRHSKSLTFVVDRDHYMYASYFRDLISTFERTARKPTEQALEDLNVEATTFAAHFLSPWTLSRFRAGEWLMNLTCLIPIHIAVARDNRFIPFKDGVWSTELERKLLGAKVEQIVDNISFGWYESIFLSYMPTKPVKVVSSMGEQSVGKSYALNHLSDTTFAGSAMRTTEGVWMSATPTEEALIVALDFEGVHSIERSAQEDTLLVLFNTALSNLVLFRNNFALSRDIAGLFQSFQSSSTILDPEANPALFKSTLMIIIKDVIESDKQEVAKEFKLKFQDIVKMEQGSNFITRLHAGSLDIIPWPVIESKEFYKLFAVLKRKLDRQPVTHHQARIFLMTMKTLMAKLKANDWGALSENMATHRCQVLDHLLLPALRFGVTEPEPDLEPLKDFDSNLPIESPDTDSVFWVSDAVHQPLGPEECLFDLMSRWDLFSERFNSVDKEWTSNLQQFLDDLFEQRSDRVLNWLNVNTKRFLAHSSTFELLKRKYENLVVDIKAKVQCCRLQCNACNLLCLKMKHHDDPHDCRTNHKCPQPCHYANEHSSEEPCGLPAGHSGDHICEITAHLCGELCDLETKRGCLMRCSKVLGHDDDEEHLCPSRLHECGEPCSLYKIRLYNGQIYSCPEACRVPCHEPHTQHKCGTRSCPISCRLCKRLCANDDHLHGLNKAEFHLCGQEHPCSAMCASSGLCSIETTPHSVEATFTGKHESFQFTKYTQVSKRLQCVIPIPSGQLDHEGAHSHSLHTDAFHYCETRCEDCGYFCTHPLGHPQQEHDTRHGSMSRTKWAIAGPDGTSIELNGRKFGASDDGAPMLCSMVCKDMGRHAHVAYCRSSDSHNCSGPEIEHIRSRLEPNPSQPKDWITHKLFWQRSGFKDPYSREDKTNFTKCDAMCSGPEHEATGSTPAQPSYCTLPIFHRPARGLVPGIGFISNDGHRFDCRNPAVMKQAFHVIFVIDRSGSMSCDDRQPLLGTPSTARIAAVNNNRLGAVYSSLDGFWIARNTVQANAVLTRRAGASKRATSAVMPPARRDAYTVILFDHAEQPAIVVQNDFVSTPQALLDSVITNRSGGGTNYIAALKTAQRMMETHWSTERTPVVIFLSDGECNVPDRCVQDLCRRAVALGKPLSFHAVAFGIANSPILRRMADLAKSIQNSVPPDPLHPSVLSSYTEALDTVRLAETFLGLADSLSKPRGFLMRNQ